MSEELTKDEIADVYSSLMSVAHSVGAIYGTPTKTLNKVLRHWTQCSKELTAVTEQRDRYKLACDQYSEDEILCKLQTVTAQRDRLAEVIAQILNTSMNHTRRELLLEQALQSLTPKNHE